MASTDSRHGSRFRLFFKEHGDRFTGAAVLLVVAAGGLLAWPGSVSGGWASLLVAGACLGWGVDNNLTAMIDRLTPAQVTFVKGLIAGGLNLLVAQDCTHVGRVICLIRLLGIESASILSLAALLDHLGSSCASPLSPSPCSQLDRPWPSPPAQP